MSRTYARMTAHDAGYLTRETDTQPLHYVLQLDLTGPASPERVRAQVKDGVSRLPLAQQQLRYPLLAGRPVWVDDSAFDTDAMVTTWPRRLETAEDRDQALHQLTMHRLPRDRPLWRLTVAQGPGDGATLWFSVHHAMMDGSLLRTLLDGLFGEATTPQAQPASSGRARRRRPPSRAWLLLLVVVRGLWLRLISLRRRSGPPMAASPEAPTSLTGVVSGDRAIAARAVSLTEARRARQDTGSTLNDLFLSVCTQALRNYLTDPPEQVIALVPRNVRGTQEATTLGNRAWSMLVPLPVGLPDAATRMQLISALTRAGKAAPTTSGTQGWRFDVALTNVALGGPHQVAGQAVRSVRAAVPLQGQNRLVAVLTSHDDELTVTWTADAGVYPDVDRLADLTSQAWSDLLAPVRGEV